MNDDGRIMKCPKCGSNENHIITKTEVVPVRGEDIELDSTIRMCRCGNELFDDHLEDQNLSKAYNMYREKHQLMSPEGIKRIRERYGLSQRTLGKILGWGEVTIYRYETGALPDNSHNKMLKLLGNPDIMKTLLEESKGAIPNSTYKRAMEIIKIDVAEREDVIFSETFQKKLKHKNLNVESGFRQFDFTRFSNVVLYFGQKINDLWKTKLNKLLFYSDFSCYKVYTVSLTGTKYLKFDYGPVPKDYEILLWFMEEQGLIKLIAKEAGPYEGYVVKSLAEYDPDVFQNYEIEILEEVYNTFGDYSSVQISDKSHQEKGWISTNFQDVISYYYASELLN